jgi:cell division transport system permease protein
MAHAQQKQKPSNYSFSVYLAHHRQACREAIMTLWRKPFASLLTVMVLGFAMALPAILWQALTNGHQLAGAWRAGPQISLYLQNNTSQQQAMGLLENIKLRTDVAAVQYISPEQGLKQFKQASGFGDSLSSLPSNPLPAVIEVTPAISMQAPYQLQALTKALQQNPGVAQAQLNLQWVQRLQAIFALGYRSVDTLMIILMLTVLLVITNTIRLATKDKRREISIIKLMGASDAYVRRPFLYMGAFYGLAGGVTAWILCAVVFLWIQPVLERLLSVYGNPASVNGFDLVVGGAMVLLSAVLGWGAALLAARS